MKAIAVGFGIGLFIYLVQVLPGQVYNGLKEIVPRLKLFGGYGALAGEKVVDNLPDAQ
jgi:hypothetical protein